MELIDYASKRGTVSAVQDLVAKALAEALSPLNIAYQPVSNNPRSNKPGIFGTFWNHELL